MVTIGANQNLEKIKKEVLAFAESMKDRELVILGHDNTKDLSNKFRKLILMNKLTRCTSF